MAKKWALGSCANLSDLFDDVHSTVIEEMKATFRRNETIRTRMAGLFQLLSNKWRFEIVCLLARGAFCVNEITEVVSEGKTSNISQHLKVLTMSGTLHRRQGSRHIPYSLRDERIGGKIRFLQRQFLEAGNR
jgi:DNA-binding transcriptional ArsR family regulator